MNINDIKEENLIIDFCPVGFYPWAMPLFESRENYIIMFIVDEAPNISTYIAFDITEIELIELINDKISLNEFTEGKELESVRVIYAYNKVSIIKNKPFIKLYDRETYLELSRYEIEKVMKAIDKRNV